MKRIALLICCILGLLFLSPAYSVAQRVQPIYTGTIDVPSDAQPKDISKAVRLALVGRGWTIQREEEGLIESKIHVRSHTANIKINFDKESIHVNYVSSYNLLYKKEGDVEYIHRNYNRWIRYLEQDISRNLYQ